MALATPITEIRFWPAARFCFTVVSGFWHCPPMKAAISTVLVILASLFHFSAQAQQPAPGQLPTMFVAPLDGDTSQVMGWQPALGEGLAEMLITELSKSGKFQMVESTALKDLAQEIKLGETGYVNEQERVEKGGWSGADFMFRGKVTRFGSNQNKVGLGGFVPGSLGNLGVKLTSADVRIDWRVVDVYNRRVIKTGSATASQKGGGFDVGTAVNGRGGRIGFDNQEFMNSALGKATVKAVDTIAQDMSGLNLPASGRSQSKMQVAQNQQAAVTAAATALRQTPGTVLAVVSKNTLIVSLGSKQGFKAGDRLQVFEKVETKDDKGTVVFTEEKPAGEVVLDVVQEDKSKATYAGTAEVKSGWTVKSK
jgi:curli biogenesis system outer membrane secretion channel CsgG